MDDASDDNVVYTPVTGYKYQVLLGEHLDQIYIKISFDIENREPEIAIFLQGDAPGLKLIIPYAYNKGTIIFKIKKKTALTFSAGIAINLGNRDFIY
jgi:hypothetical protein